MRFVDVRNNSEDESVGYKFDSSIDYVFLDGDILSFSNEEEEDEAATAMCSIGDLENFIKALRLAAAQGYDEDE